MSTVETTRHPSKAKRGVLSNNTVPLHAISVIEQLATDDKPDNQEQSTDATNQSKTASLDSDGVNELIANLRPMKRFSDFTGNQLDIFKIVIGYGASTEGCTKLEYINTYNQQNGTQIKAAQFPSAVEAVLRKLAHIVRQKGNPTLPLTQDWVQLVRTRQLDKMWQALQTLNEEESYAGYSLFGAIELALNKRRRRSNGLQAERENDGSELGPSVFEMLKSPPPHILRRIGIENEVKALTTNDHTIPTMYWELVKYGDLKHPEDIPEKPNDIKIAPEEKTEEMERLMGYGQTQIIELCAQIALKGPKLKRMADKFIGHMRRERRWAKK